MARKNNTGVDVWLRMPLIRFAAFIKADDLLEAELARARDEARRRRKR